MIKPNEPFSIYIYISMCIYIYVKLQDLQTKKHKKHSLGAAPCPSRDAEVSLGAQSAAAKCAAPCHERALAMSYGDVLW